MKALVICTTAMSRLYIHELAKKLLWEHESILIISHMQSKIFDDTTVSSLLSLGVELQLNSFTNNFERFVSLRNLGQKIRNEMSEGDLTILFAHPWHVLTSFPAFHSQNFDNVSLQLIPDGAANHFMVDVNRYKHTTTPKKVVGALTGMQFIPTKSNMLGLGEIPYSKFWYVGSPGIMGSYMLTEEIPILRAGVSAARENTLFIGAPVGTGIGSKKEYEKAIRAAAVICKGDFYYRPHPAEEHDFPYITAVAGRKVIPLISSKAAELDALKFERVIGTYSSVLQNLRLLGWHDDVYGLTDPNRIQLISEVTLAECVDIATLNARIGIKSL